MLSLIAEYIHVILASIATALVIIAAFLTFSVKTHFYMLHKHPNNYFIKLLPTIETSNKILTIVLTTGLIILTCTILIAFSQFSLNKHLTHKIVVSVIAWAVLGMGLWLRLKGNISTIKTEYYLLAATLLLILGYFISRRNIV